MIVTDVFRFQDSCFEDMDEKLDKHIHSRQVQDGLVYKDIKVLDEETIIIIWEKYE